MRNAILMLAVFLFASPALAHHDRDHDEADIRKVTKETCDAYRDGNVKKMKELLTEDFTLTDASGVVTTRADDIANAESGAVKYEIFENYDMTVRLYGDSSVVTGKTRVKGMAGTTAFAVEFQFTDTLVRQNGKWKFAASHVSRLTPPKPAAAVAPAEVEAELKRLTQENLDAIAPGHVEVWRKNLHDNMTHVDENDVVRTKSELLKEFSPLPKGLVGRLEVGKFQVQQFDGNVAVATHEDLEHLEYHGQMLVSRWRTTDTWLKTADGWKLIGEQTLAVLEDPPSIALPEAQLCSYAGVYRLTPEINDEIHCKDGALTSKRTGRPEATYKAEVADVFFAPGRPRTRRIFLRENGQVTGFVDRREGIDIKWKRMK